LSDEELTEKLMSFYKEKKLSESFVRNTVPLIKERIKTLADYYPLISFLLNRPKEYEVDLSESKEFLLQVVTRMEAISEWKAETIGAEMVALAKELGIPNS